MTPPSRTPTIPNALAFMPSWRAFYPHEVISLHTRPIRAFSSFRTAFGCVGRKSRYRKDTRLKVPGNPAYFTGQVEEEIQAEDVVWREALVLGSNTLAMSSTKANN
jgi:hypothetical protein